MLTQLEALSAVLTTTMMTQPMTVEAKLSESMATVAMGATAVAAGVPCDAVDAAEGEPTTTMDTQTAEHSAATSALRSAAELPSRSVPSSCTSFHCRAVESGGAADAAEDEPEASRWWRWRSTLARHWELTVNETTAMMAMLWLS